MYCHARCAAACHLRPKRCVAPYISPSKPRKALEPRSSLVPSLTDTQLVSSLHRLTMLVLNEKDAYAPSSAPRSVVRNETPLDTEHTLMTASSRRIRKSSRTPLHTLDQVPHLPLLSNQTIPLLSKHRFLLPFFSQQYNNKRITCTFNQDIIPSLVCLLITGMRLVQPQHTDSSPAGSYIINSEISPFAWSSKECQRVPLSKKNSKFFKRPHTSNARFETRHGAITLNLATAGTDDTKLTRTYVQASSWHAKININLVGCQL